VADQNAITVEANDVTIDLAGYSLIGRGSGAGSGIFMQARENVEVRNGSVLQFGGYGIWSWDGCTVLDNTSSYNQYGIYVEGAGALIKGNTVRGSEVDSLYVKGTKNAIESNLVTGCTNGSGIYFETSGNFYSNNRASGNKTNYSGPSKPTGAPGDGGGNVGF
jgi:parallel beta-helix repeat protein